eukprot:TRINITY_DN12141_c0_g2_i1.p1 TRINITY_DN12141_c0_g2~~TRINITY_DN12141_c0_g2_i1.p1  ORF type:complete len:643 (-),score=111.62 TRINITY_DN12141_c0_g2_i1:798-2696(-)
MERSCAFFDEHSLNESISCDSSCGSGVVMLSDFCSSQPETSALETKVMPNKEFSSFVQVRAHLCELFRPFGLRIRARDTKYPQGLSKDQYGEESVSGKKYMCCCDGCTWSAWFRKKTNGLIALGRSYCFEHNHELSLVEGGVPRGAKDFTAEERLCLEALRLSQVGGKKSHRFMESLFHSTYTEWTIRNYIRRDRAKEIELDPERFMDMIGSSSMEGLTVHCIHVDEDGTWDMIFIGLREGLNDYLENGRFISVDATAETNRYGLLCVTVLSQDYSGRIKAIAYAFVPRESSDCYVWIFKQLRVFFSNNHPTLIISDNHPSIFAAIRTVFPSVPHRLRAWLPKWCDAFLPETFVGRRSTTSINESQHNRLKLTLNTTSTLVDCLSIILECKKNEIVAPKLRKLKVDVTNGNTITSLAADILDREINAGLLRCVSSIKSMNYWVVREEEAFGGCEFDVTMEDEFTFKCSCGFIERMLLPCRHVVSVFSLRQCLPRVGEQINSYWFREKAAIQAKITSCVEGEITERSPVKLPSDPMCEFEYGETKSFVNELFVYHKVPGFQESLTNVVELIKRETQCLKAKAREMKGKRHRLEGDETRPPPDVSFVGGKVRKRKKNAPRHRSRTESKKDCVRR